MYSGHAGSINHVQFTHDEMGIMASTSNHTIAFYNDFNSRDLCVLKGSNGRVVPYTKVLAAISDMGLVELHSNVFYANQFRQLDAILESAPSVTDIKNFFISSELSHFTRLLNRQQAAYVDIIGLFHENQFDNIITTFPDLAVFLPKVSSVSIGSDNALSKSLKHKNRITFEQIISLFCQHFTAYDCSGNSDARYYTEGLAIARLFGWIAEDFPTLTYEIMDTFIVDVTPSQLLGPADRFTLDTDNFLINESDIPKPPQRTNLYGNDVSIPHLHPVTVKTIVLPEIVNLKYWRSQRTKVEPSVESNFSFAMEYINLIKYWTYKGIKQKTQDHFRKNDITKCPIWAICIYFITLCFCAPIGLIASILLGWIYILWSDIAKKTNRSLLDPLSILANHDLTHPFTLPAVRAILDYRWGKVKNYFYMQFFLYIAFLSSFTAFALFLAKDDISISINDVYSGSNSSVYLYLGLLSQSLNIWFLVTNFIEICFCGLRFRLFFDEWNWFELPTNILLPIVTYLHINRMREEFSVTAVAILFAWFNLLSHFRGFSGSGIFVRLVLKILFEIRYFLLVWSVFLLGFANAYIILFQGDNQDAFTPESTGDLHFLNMGTAFISMFKGSTGGGLDLIWRGDSSYPNGASAFGSNGTILFPMANSQLYHIQLVMFVLFTMVCNVLLLNLLIALMSSVYDDVNQKAASQYRLDKVRLMLEMETILISVSHKIGAAKRWLHVVAPKDSSFWNADHSDVEDVKNHVDAKFDHFSTLVENKFSVIDNKFESLENKIELIHRNVITLSRQFDGPRYISENNIESAKNN